MLKIASSLEKQAKAALCDALDKVSTLRVLGFQEEVRLTSMAVDLVADVDIRGRKHRLVCEVKSNGQPRYVREAVLQLKYYISKFEPRAIPILIAPYLSSAAQDICRAESVNYLDLEGNTRLELDDIFIEREVPTKPRAQRRELKSIFKPKSAQVLRVMLRDPRHSWRMVDLANEAHVSLGHISNVRTALLDREWGHKSDEGFYLSEPDLLLDAWRENYVSPAGERQTYYTPLHGSGLDKAFVELPKAGQAVFASFSAAQWLAPYARVSTSYFYSDSNGLTNLISALRLSPTTMGENVVVTLLADEGPLLDTVEPSPGVVCTSPVQTYLDLANAGERGREAADHLRHEKLKWRS